MADDGLIDQKEKSKAGMVWDWLTKKSKLQADEPKKNQELNGLDKDKLDEVSKSFKGAF